MRRELAVTPSPMVSGVIGVSSRSFEPLWPAVRDGVLAWNDDWVHRDLPHEAFPSDHLPHGAQFSLSLHI